VLSNKCASGLNWKGRGRKLAFTGMSLRTVICASVRLNPLTSKATDGEIEQHMKEWLKFAVERDGRRKERDQMKASGRDSGEASAIV